MKQNDLMHERTASVAGGDLFTDLSRDELLTVLGVMHRILEAERKRDLDHLVTELPTLFADRRGTQRAHDAVQSWERLPAAAATLPKGEHTYQALHYVFSCLSKAQARMSASRTGRLRAGKNPSHLSPRELTVLLWMKEGKTNWEIARILGLSERTVRFHVGGIFEKLDVTSRTQAVARALGAGLIAS
jgi:DNA-binding CsgD family transcriptional regulator